MVEPTHWDETTVRNLIRDGVTENLTLDYKAAAALKPKTQSVKNEIGKDVSSFANSAGGTIIYGIVERNHLPVSVDGIDPIVVTREWLEQVISSRIQRRVDGVRIHQVLLSDGNVVYIVDIPQSDRAPHMASDHRYYKRFEFQSVPMEEYEVRDVANRAAGPRLTIRVRLEANALSFVDGEEWSQPLDVRASVVNESAVPAEHAVFHWLADVRLQGGPGGFTNRQEVQLSVAGSTATAHCLWQKNWGVPGKMPIWEGMPFGLFDTVYEVQVPRGAGQYVLGWCARAPRMTRASRILFLVVDESGFVSLHETEASLDL